MAQKLQSVCALIVDDTCGHLGAQVFSTLAENGRLSRPQLQHHTRIPGRQLRHALTILVQQHIILHYTSDDDITFYQVDWRNTYHLIRSNRIITLVEERYDEGAGRIIANLLQLGHARVADLAQAFDLMPVAKRDSGIEASGRTNGQAKNNGTDAHTMRKTHGKIETVAQFHNTLRTLLKSDFLVKLGKRAYMPAADLQYEIEETVINESFPDRKVTGPKKQAEFKIAVNGVKRKWRDANEYSEHRDVEAKGIIRRPGAQPAAKRTKLNGGMTNGIGHGDDDSLDDENVAKLPNDMVLRVNYPRSTLAFRSHRLEQLAEPYLGPVTSEVYGALLQVLEAKVRARDDNIQVDENPDDEEDDLPTASTLNVADLVRTDLDLTLGIQGASEDFKLPNGHKKSKRKKEVLDEEFADIGIKRESYSDDEDEHPVAGYTSLTDRNKRLSLIEEHLKLLEEHPIGFCKRVGGGGRGEWRVHFPDLTNNLIHAEIDSTILVRFGKIHVRMVRLLRERGRLEDKQVAALSMMRIKDVRAVLTELQFAGIVESQEVPKDASRTPQRTVFLWFHDQGRVQSLLLQETYQGMSRTMQRLSQEREHYKKAIEKAEMMDFKQADLNQNEKEAVMQWREVEEKLVGQTQRMDDLVALLRDFSGKDSSLIS